VQTALSKMHTMLHHFEHSRLAGLAALVAVALAVACGGDSGGITGPAPSITRRAEVKVTQVTLKEEAPKYTIDVKYPQTGLPGSDAKIRQLVEPMAAEIKKAALADNFSAGKYTLEGDFKTALAGPDIVSIVFDVYTYTGGAHGAHATHGLNFDAATGRELTLDDALSLTGLTLAQLADQSATKLKAKLGDMYMFPEGAAAKRENYDTFAVSSGEVTFFFSEYQVAPYAAGPSEVSFQRKPAGPR
jgi:hypothetical protein